MVKGIVRHIDELGRVVIPMEIRKSLKIKDTDPVDIYLNGRTICIEKVNAVCVCCGVSEESTKLLNYKGVLMCPDCHPGTANKEEK